MDQQFEIFVGIDWGSEQHRVCVVNPSGDVVEQKWVEHAGQSLADLVSWLRDKTAAGSGKIAVAIELPRGPVVETLMEQGFAVFSINPKQLDRFRDRYSPAGAKDDQRDAFVLADSLRTDMHCFHAVRLDEPAVIRLRELSRLDDDRRQEQNRLHNQLREQWHRFFPQLLHLSSAANEPWVWDLFQAAPLPLQATKLTTTRLQRILNRHRIRRLDASAVKSVLAATPLSVAPGAAEAASEHALLLLPRLHLLQQQRAAIAKKLEALLEQLAAPNQSGETVEHRDAEVLLPCRESEDRSPPRCSAKPHRQSPNEIIMVCAATQGLHPLPGKVAKSECCSCAKVVTSDSVMLFIIGLESA